MKRDGLTESPAGRWTRAEDYLDGIAWTRSSHRRRSAMRAADDEPARLLLSTVPFLALLSLLGVLAVGMMVLAFPTGQPQAQAPERPQHELGVAQKGWYQEAQRQFHN